MMNSQRLCVVRDCLREWLNKSYPDEVDAADPRGEATLIRDGFFCGRRFRFPLHQAVWFVEEDEVKIRDLQGNVLATLRGEEIDQAAESWRVECAHPRPTLSIVGVSNEDSQPQEAGQSAATDLRDSESLPMPQLRAA